jgi:hypothetical protein
LWSHEGRGDESLLSLLFREWDVASERRIAAALHVDGERGSCACVIHRRDHDDPARQLSAAVFGVFGRKLARLLTAAEAEMELLETGD